MRSLEAASQSGISYTIIEVQRFYVAQLGYVGNVVVNIQKRDYPENMSS